MKVTEEMIAKAAKKADDSELKMSAAGRRYNVALGKQELTSDGTSLNRVQMVEYVCDLRITKLAYEDAYAEHEQNMNDLIKLHLMKRAQSGDHLAQRALKEMTKDEQPMKKHQ